MAFANGSSGLRIRLSLALKVALLPVSDATGIMNRSVTPDSPQLIAVVGAIGFPSLRTFQSRSFRSIFAPNVVIAFDVASVSSQYSAFVILVVPADKRPATKARGV